MEGKHDFVEEEADVKGPKSINSYNSIMKYSSCMVVRTNFNLNLYLEHYLKCNRVWLDSVCCAIKMQSCTIMLDTPIQRPERQHFHYPKIRFYRH